MVLLPSMLISSFVLSATLASLVASTAKRKYFNSNVRSLYKTKSPPSLPLFSPLQPKTLLISQYTYQFDNIGSNAALPELSPVGVYNELLRNAFSVVPPSDTGINEGLVAHSPPNMIASGIPERPKNGTAFIISLYHYSPVESFDLKGFYFGCTPDVVTGEATLADGCVVTTVCSAGILYYYILSATRLCTVPVYFHVLPPLCHRLCAFLGIPKCTGDLRIVTKMTKTLCQCLPIM